jgi:serine/threonine-protein kinase RsbW
VSSVSARVTIEIPAQAEYVAVLRAASGVIATRLDFTLDDIDDLRILVDEAASVLLSAGAAGVLRCDIDVEDAAIRFQLRGELPDGEQPHGEGFAWSILNALAHEVRMDVDNDEHVISVTRSRGPVLDGAF